ncbi:16S rRNA (uracil(1498)-N(3))-methyltransferase [Poseidonibacter parvus]|uniref:Ribosomal RNA small subunit methyltransferase E n=1 Tax=Poseidonibacter parvus TaxID=1850254 RepID=A0A1P8KJI6_9BACT|nr:16S rRNA (uracil(1498)-N(3))-methyltransferase [Poseidonibacter parvus]APW64705.1 16S rRNA (uracil(1498)-N(3))-methyltransferase [Poseidonibacter parvus]
MQFTYDINCGNEFLEISDDTYKYLIKARRHKINDEIYFRNLKNDLLYLYKLSSINRRSASFNLISSEEKIVRNENSLHLIWCLVDPKTIEKYLASLNELGVEKITFVYCEYSQKNFKLNFEKLEKILINSSSQCGRSDIIKLDFCNSLEEVMKENENVYFLDFSDISIDDKKEDIKTLVIGCEGGFSKDERLTFNKEKIVGFKSNIILRSETAILSAASKILI